jgi:hypothetical protein
LERVRRREGSSSSRWGLSTNLELECIVLDRTTGRLASLIRTCGETFLAFTHEWRFEGLEFGYGGFESLLRSGNVLARLGLQCPVETWYRRPATDTGFSFRFNLRESINIDGVVDRGDDKVEMQAPLLAFLLWRLSSCSWTDDDGWAD